MLTSRERFSECRISVALGLTFVCFFIWMLFTPPVVGERSIAVGATSLLVCGVCLAASLGNLPVYLLGILRALVAEVTKRGWRVLLFLIGTGYLGFGVYSIFDGIRALAV